MKKLLFFVMAAAMYCGCDKEEGAPCPVTGVELPASSAENPVQAGTSVTIQGSGFTAESEIWLRAGTRAADVQAEVIGTTATAITFVAPPVSGAQTVLLKQHGGVWPLGRMYFAGGADILPKKIVRIVCVSDSYDESTTIKYTYNENGRLKQIDKEETYSTSVTSIEYAQNSVTARYGNGVQQIFHLENGRVTSGRYNESDYTCETEYAYGDNGYLTAAKMTEAQDGEKETYRAALTIKDGCLDKYSVDGFSLNYTPNTAVPNNLNLDLLGFDEFLDDIDESVAEAYWLGVGGTRTKYLPEQLTINDYGDRFTLKYGYKFNGEYLSEIRITGEGIDETLKLYYEE